MTGTPRSTRNDHPVLAEAARIALLCNDAVLEEEEGVWTVRGDPTEGALMVLGRKAGLDPEDRLVREFPRVAEIPFDSERKRMSTIHQGPGWAFDVRQGRAGKPAVPVHPEC